MNQKIRNVVMCFGTHGDERTGIDIATMARSGLFNANIKSFTTSWLCVNPDAVEKNVRYIDEDIQDFFDSLHQYDSGLKESLELKRSREMTKILGGLQTTSTESNPDFIIDMHDTNCNMGITINVSWWDGFTTALCSYMYSKFPSIVKIWYSPEDRMLSPSLQTIGREWICLECGNVEDGKSNPFVQNLEMNVISSILDWVDQSWNAGYKQQKRPIPVYRELCVIPYERGFKVCKWLLNKDYQPLGNGSKLLENGKGKFTHWMGSTVYPIFIDEKSYLDPSENDAMEMTELKVMML